MKIKSMVINTTVVALLLCNVSGALAADKVPDNAMKMSQLLQNIEKNGYGIIKSIKFDDGEYKATAINNQGDEVKLQIAPQSGEILKPKENAGGLSIIEATQKVEQAGYRNIFEIDVKKDKYEMKAYDQKDKKVSLDVDAKSGKISD
jgi:hypothetical protein